ncbi:hypothetical protein [Solilutibacter silvestris]|nr:hypothetical protein [Lysobacter silvestris]
MNPLYLFLFFILIAITFHIALVRHWPLNELNWKKVDYLWISLSLISIIGLSATIRTDWYSTTLIIDRYARQSRLEDLKHALADATGAAICRATLRTEYSPSNIDQIVAEYQSACEVFKKLSSIDTLNNKDEARGFVELLPESLQPLRRKFNQPEIIEEFDSIENAHNGFLKSIQEENKTRNLASKSDFEKIMSIFAAPLLVIALALRLTKVTGEISLKKVMKHSSQNPDQQK